MLEVIRALFGILFILFLGYVFSNNRKAINWRTLFAAFTVQFTLAAIVLWIPAGKNLLLGISNGISNVIAFGQQGVEFLFGKLSNQTLGFIFAFNVLPVIIFFSALISILYYMGIMGVVIKIIGGGLQKFLGTSQSESMSATANIFVGPIEAPLVIKPYLNTMTKSELFAVMVGGLASVSGSVLAGFVGIGVELKYLISASFMAAPAGLLMAKMLIPETATPKKIIDIIYEPEPHINIIDAAAAGAIQGLKLAAHIGAVLLAFISLLALMNGFIGWLGQWIGYPDLTLQTILGYIFRPLAYIVGTSWEEAKIAGSLIGQKVVINEFVAYLDFVNYKGQLSEKTNVIVTFALCGFANFGSIAVLLGGLGSLAPTRRSQIAKYGLRAVLAGSLANLLSGAIAGLFFTLSTLH